MRKKEKKILILLIIISIILLNLYLIKDKIGFYINIGRKYTKYLNEEYINYNNDSYNKDNIDKINSINYLDVEYKNVNGKSLKLDIYGPEKDLKKGSPVIIYIHAGGWAYGNKEIPKTIEPIIRPFREEGYTIISVEYELMDKNEIFEKQVSDIKDCIRWIYKNKEVYDFDTENIGIIGISSGAHLGMMASYSEDEDFVGTYELKDYPSKVKYMIDLFGPTDLSTLEESLSKFNLEKTVLNSLIDKQEIIAKFSPINYIKNRETNTLIIHSKKDDIVPYENSEKLYNKLKENNSKVEMLTLDETSHDFSSSNDKELIEIGLRIFKYIAKNM
ncbi:prolyl oligopeptidase family serine peptidase [Clostridium sp.]|uniref:prolyl oligopeptidase family serine peptidase n=1 Tax=Clostridium sp. TaxID=1506 RepID=UPI002627BAC7|nr:prolyl oligopeptidase family serine peptidase [Clostridium sp.]